MGQGQDTQGGFSTGFGDTNPFTQFSSGSSLANTQPSTSSMSGRYNPYMMNQAPSQGYVDPYRSQVPGYTGGGGGWGSGTQNIINNNLGGGMGGYGGYGSPYGMPMGGYGGYGGPPGWGWQQPQQPQEGSAGFNEMMALYSMLGASGMGQPPMSPYAGIMNTMNYMMANYPDQTLAYLSGIFGPQEAAEVMAQEPMAGEGVTMAPRPMTPGVRGDVGNVPVGALAGTDLGGPMVNQRNIDALNESFQPGGSRFQAVPPTNPIADAMGLGGDLVNPDAVSGWAPPGGWGAPAAPRRDNSLDWYRERLPRPGNVANANISQLEGPMRDQFDLVGRDLVNQRNIDNWAPPVTSPIAPMPTQPAPAANITNPGFAPAAPAMPQIGTQLVQPNMPLVTGPVPAPAGPEDPWGAFARPDALAAANTISMSSPTLPTDLFSPSVAPGIIDPNFQVGGFSPGLPTPPGMNIPPWQPPTMPGTNPLNPFDQPGLSGHQGLAANEVAMGGPIGANIGFAPAGF